MSGPDRRDNRHRRRHDLTMSVDFLADERVEKNRRSILTEKRIVGKALRTSQMSRAGIGIVGKAIRASQISSAGIEGKALRARQMSSARIGN